MRPASVHQSVSDHAGRFRQGGASASGAGMSYGEEHELEEKLELEALKRVAAKIDEIVAVALGIFALTTILGWAYYGERCWPCRPSSFS